MDLMELEQKLGTSCHCLSLTDAMSILESEGKATTMVSDAIASGDIQAVNYFVAQKYVEALSSFATGPNTKTLLLPMEASGILSSLAGITEIARETFKAEDRQ